MQRELNGALHFFPSFFVGLKNLSSSRTSGVRQIVVKNVFQLSGGERLWDEVSETYLMRLAGRMPGLRPQHVITGDRDDRYMVT